MNTRSSEATQHVIETRPGLMINYSKTGTGPALVLLHTIRTESAYFEKLIPLLQENFTVYAVDLPGHGQSTIESSREFDEPYFRSAIVEFVLCLGLHDVVLAGESIGGVLALTVASEMPERVHAVVASNPYDYDQRYGDGVRRGNFLANVVIGAFSMPIIGIVVAALENPIILAGILRGGFHAKSRLPWRLVRKFDRTGRRHGYRQLERGVFSAWRSWGNARIHYRRLKAPVTLVYGEHDWSSPKERERNFLEFPEARRCIIPKSGHFIGLENPFALAREILLRRPP